MGAGSGGNGEDDQKEMHLQREWSSKGRRTSQGRSNRVESALLPDGLILDKIRQQLPPPSKLSLFTVWVPRGLRLLPGLPSPQLSSITFSLVLLSALHVFGASDSSRTCGCLS